MDWSDVPYVLAVCETGSLSGAARTLGVNHSTVFRRIEAVEAKLGVRLFERLSHGYVMTAAGEHFYRNGVQLQDGMQNLQRELGGQDLRLEGRLTVTTTDSLLYCLASVFSQFQQQYPEVELQLVSESRALNLTQRDADIALRPTRNPPEHWIGKKLFAIACATYARREYWEAAQHQSASSYRWIRLSDSLNLSPMNQVMNRYKHDEAPVTVANTMMGVFELVRLGLGIGAMPCYLGEHCTELVRVHPPEDQFTSELWMLAHPDMRRSAKVQAFFEFAATQITEDFVRIAP